MDPFCGEIRMFGGNYAPRGWELCNGKLINISDNHALYSLLGNRYGGDGRITFGLPDMRGRLPMHYGAGPGLTPRVLGRGVGTELAQLESSQMPSHTHSINANSNPTTSVNDPTGQVLAKSPEGLLSFSTDVTTSAELNELALANTGGNKPHSNIMPSQVLNFIICTNGIYPSRN